MKKLEWADILIIIGAIVTLFWVDPLTPVGRIGKFDYQIPKWVPLCYLLSVPIAIAFWKRFNILVGLFAGLLLVQFASVLVVEQNHLQLLRPVRGDMTMTSGRAFFVLALLGSFAFLIKNRWHERIKDAIAITASLNAFAILCQWPFVDSFQRGGFFGNASISASFIAFTWPFVYRFKYWGKEAGWKKILIVLFFGAAIIATESSMGAAAFIATFSAFSFAAFLNRRGIKDWVCWLVSSISWFWVPVSFVGLAIWQMGAAKLFDSSGRKQFWSWYMDFWKLQAHPNWGFGPGTSELILDKIARNEYGYDGNSVNRMDHSDWPIQMIFEQGILAAFLAFLIFLSCIYGARKTPYLVASLVGFLVCVVGNYPFHIAPHAFVGVFLAILAIGRNERDVTLPSF